MSVLEAHTCHTDPQVRIRAFITDPQVCIAAFLTDPQVCIAAFLTDPQVCIAAFLTDPQVCIAAFLTDPQVCIAAFLTDPQVCIGAFLTDPQVFIRSTCQDLIFADAGICFFQSVVSRCQCSTSGSLFKLLSSVHTQCHAQQPQKLKWSRSLSSEYCNFWCISPTEGTQVYKLIFA